MYGVNVFTLGVKHTVIVDDYLPLQQRNMPDGSTDYVTLFSHVAEDESLWGVILEKAFAKLHGNYKHLVSGDPRDASRALNGSPSIMDPHSDSELTIDALWDKIYEHDINDEMMFFNTKAISGSFLNKCKL